ncbi:MAG TPA: hypothetical protein PLP17_14735, partial [Oligoflexia bacterium]|nr:hypothetical protein [Oligoflexia bacterium]
YRLLIVICILLGFGLAHYQNKKAVRLYSSTSLVNISSYVPVSEGIVSRSLREESSKEYYLEMLLALLKSFKIAERVLASNEDVRKFLGVKGAFVSSVPSPLEKNADSTNPVDPKYAAALKSYLRRIDTQHVKDSGLVKIIATTNKPKMSALMANLHAEQFIQLVLEDRKLKAEVTLNFLQGRLSEAEAALNDVRERKLAYARQNPAIAANVESIHRSFQAKYDRLMSGMTQVAAETSAKSNYLRLLNRRSMEDVAAGAGEMSSIMNVEKLRSEYEAWRKVIKNDQSPYLAEYRRQIKIAETALARHARIKRESAESAYRLSRDREEMLKKEFDRLAAEEKEHSSVRVEYDALLLEEAVAKEAVDKLSDRLNDAVLNSQNEQKTVVLIDPAVPDPVPVSPNTKANLIKGTLLGLFLGMVLAFLLDVSDTSIRTIQDL